MDNLHRADDKFHPPVEKAPATARASYIRSKLRRALKDDDLALVETIGSQSRMHILELLGKGVDHPEDLAKKLKLRRQSIDKQLLELYACGFVDRSAVFPADGRPRIVYRVSDRGQYFLARMEALVAEYREGIRADHQRSLNLLEKKLAEGDLDEDAYLKQRKALDARYARFIEEL